MKLLLIIGVSIAATLGAVAGVGSLFGGGGRFGGQGADEATPVRVEPVQRGTLVEVVSAPGEVQPKLKVSISAKVTARVTDLPFKEGERVTKGDPDARPPVAPSVLLRLDAKDLEAGLRSAEARFAGRRAELKVSEARIAAQRAQINANKVMLAEAERDLRRQRQLLESQDVSASVVDTAQSKVDELKAQLDSAEHGLAADEANLVVMRHSLEAAEAEIAQARDNLSYTVITSPIDGIITRLNTQVGELALTGSLSKADKVMMEVADPAQMLMVARVDETSIAAVKVGQKAAVRIHAYADEVFPGRVEAVAPANTDAKDGSKYYEVEVLLETHGRMIFSGLTGDADIEADRHEGALRVPSQAVLARPVDDLPREVAEKEQVDRSKTYATVVYRYVDGKALATPVAVAASDLTHTMIRSGLNEGDVVITGPYKVLEGLAHDQKVREDADAAKKALAPPVAPAQGQGRGA